MDPKNLHLTNRTYIALKDETILHYMYGCEFVTKDTDLHCMLNKKEGRGT